MYNSTKNIQKKRLAMTYPYENLENFTLKSLIDRSISLYPDQPALAKISQEPISYSELGKRIQETIRMLQSNGIQKGDKVAVLSENMPNWAIAYLSITYFGGVVVPILPDFHRSDVHHIIHHSEAKAIFVSEKHLTTVEELNDSQLHFIVKLDNLEVVDSLTNHSYMTKIKQKLTSSSKELTIPAEDDMAALLYTSGTTGNSKGVMLSQKNITTNALSSHSKVTITSEDVFLSILPLAHTFECTVGLIIPLLHGASVQYIDKAPTPSVLLKAFSIVKPTMMVSVPLVIEKIYKNKVLPKFTSSFVMKSLYGIPFFRKKLNKIAGKKLIETFGGRLRFFGIGGAGISPYVEQFLKEAEFPYIIGYGLTETSPLLAGSVMGSEIKLGSTGTLFPHVAVKVKDPDPQTGSGELLFQSPSLMLGYYKDKEQSAEVIEDGWFKSGDLGYIDEDGYIFINGRSKNVIIGSGGENIFPEQIEATINQHEAVLDSLVMMRDERLIAKVHLDYELIDKMFEANKNPESEVKEKINNLLEDMRVDVNNQVSSYCKMVKFIEQIEPFIKTPTKKIKRFLYVE